MVDWWIWGVEFLVLLVLLLLIPVVWLLVRRRWIAGRGRAFQCSLRRADGHDHWSLGVARIRGDQVAWYASFSPSWAPSVRFHREDTRVVRVRLPDAAEAAELYPGHLIVELGGVHEGVALAMTRPDLTAFSSWTEAAPPGIPGSGS